MESDNYKDEDINETYEDLIPQDEAPNLTSKLRGLGRLVTIGILVASSSLLFTGCRDYPGYHHWGSFHGHRYTHYRRYYPAPRHHHRGYYPAPMHRR